MEITKIADGTTLTVALDGKLSATAAQELEAELKECLEGVTDVVLDCGKLSYITSAGLRVLLSTGKKMKQKKGMFKICNANEEVMKIFDMTGMKSVLTIE